MKKKIIIVILLFMVAIGSYLFLNNRNSIDDFYEYVNKEEIKKIELKDKNEISTFTIAKDEVDKDVDKIVEDLLKSNKNMSNFYNNIIDYDTRNKLGISPIKGYINKINSSSNIDELIKNAIDLEVELGIPFFSNVGVQNDLKDTSTNVVYLDAITFEFSSPCYYYNEDNYAAIEAYIKGAGVKTLKLYGYDKKEARNISNNINTMINNVCSNSLKEEDQTNYEKLYNKYTKEELKKLYSNLDIDYYLTKHGINNQKFYIVGDIENFKGFNAYLVNSNLNLLKEFFTLKILEMYGSVLSTDYLDISINLSNKIGGTTYTKDDYNKVYYDTIKSAFSNEIDEVYLTNYYDEENKEYITKMINEIIDYYKGNIKNYTWMSKETKNKAYEKLDKMTINVGGPDKISHYTDKYDVKSHKEGSNLVENMINMHKVSYDYMLEGLTKKHNDWLISSTTVNAYYNPLDNSINFPAALISLYDIKDDYYKNLGGIGMIIAHEITHALDSNGAKFDEKGNMNNWWTDKDLKKFNELTESVADYYSSYKVINGLYVNGKKTLGENIADLGALNAITNIAESKKATDKDYKIMYESFAKLWLNKSTDTYAKLILKMDNHSPAKIRVNATLSSTDKFYEVYNIKSNDKMYKSEKERVSIW